MTDDDEDEDAEAEKVCAGSSSYEIRPGPPIQYGYRMNDMIQDEAQRIHQVLSVLRENDDIIRINGFSADTSVDHYAIDDRGCIVLCARRP